MANNPRNSNQFRAAGREKFDLNLRSYLEICHGKQAHADVAEIDTKTIQLGRLGEYLHGGVQQLAFPASPVWFEAPFEDHLSTGKDTVAKRSLRAKITNVQWNGERLFNRYLGLSENRQLQNRAAFRGSQTSSRLTWGLRRSCNQAAQVPSSKVRDRVPCSPWMNSTIVDALVSSRHSMISLPAASITATEMVA